jgi:hypothetical protein
MPVDPILGTGSDDSPSIILAWLTEFPLFNAYREDNLKKVLEF